MQRRGYGWVCVATVVLAGCGAQEDRRPIAEVRRLPPIAGNARTVRAGSPQAAAAEATPPKALQWLAPDGWVEARPRPVRLVTFEVGPAAEAECYVTVLGGDGGGVELNVNRWREQMGLDPLGREAVAELPTITLAGREAPWVELTGVYQGMRGEARPDWMLLAAAALLDEEAVFVKMVGPEAVVRAERDRFIAFCGSLR